jgi:hypothetical protein
MQTGQTIASDVPYTSRNGDYSFVRVHLSPFVDDRGEIHGVQGLVEDFSERKNSEIRLNEAHVLASAEAQKLRSVSKGIPGRTRVIEAAYSCVTSRVLTRCWSYL